MFLACIAVACLWLGLWKFISYSRLFSWLITHSTAFPTSTLSSFLSPRGSAGSGGTFSFAKIPPHIRYCLNFIRSLPLIGWSISSLSVYERSLSKDRFLAGFLVYLPLVLDGGCCISFGVFVRWKTQT
jgi:hypothetical protein